MTEPLPPRLPTRWRSLYLGLTDGTYSPRWLLSHLVLILIFYGVVTPIGLVLRLCGHDPLARHFQPRTTSYWKARPPAPAPDSYFKQS